MVLWYILLAFILICWIQFTIIYLINKYIQIRFKRIRKHFNNTYQLFSFGNFDYLYVYTKNDKSYEQYYKEINKFNEKYESIIKDLKSIISTYLSKYRFTSNIAILKYCKQIHEKINDLGQIANNLKQIAKSNRSQSSIFKNIAVIGDCLHDLKVLNNINIEKINTNNEQISIEINIGKLRSFLINNDKYDKKQANLYLNDIYNNTLRFIDISKNKYTNMLLCNYNVTLINAIDDLLKKHIDHDNLDKFKKLVAEAHDNLIEIEDMNNTKNLRDKLIANIKKAELIMKNIKDNIDSKKLYMSCKAQIKKLFDNSLNLSLDDIVNNIKLLFNMNNKPLNTMCTNIIKLITNIKMLIDSISIGNKKVSFTYCKMIVSCIWSLKEKLDDLYISAYEHYNTCINTIYKLNNYNLILSQLINNYSIDEEQVNSFIAIYNKNNEMIGKLEGDYFNNAQEIYANISEIEEGIATNLKEIANNSIITQINKKLIMYANKYRLEHEEINKKITQAEDFYVKKEYNKSIDILIDTLSKIKNDAKKNKVIFI